MERPSCSRKGIRRFLVDQHVRKEVNHTIRALNSMYGCPESGSTMISLEEELFGHGAAQLKAVDHVLQSVHAIGKPPSDLTGSGAFESLRAAEGYSHEPAVGSLCSFNLEKVSLPEGDWSPIPLSDLWGPDGRELVEDFVTSQLLPPQEVEKRLRGTGVQQPYSDPLLTVRSNYVHFLQKLHKANLVEFSEEAPAENIAISFVTKKNDRQRMIVDARRSNAHFRDPAYVHLCTGDTLSRLEYGFGDSLTIGMADLKDAFYHLQLPVQLRRFFCLPRVRCEDLDWLNFGSHRPCKGKWAVPRLTVVPMGWSWALYWCQKLHERIVLHSGLQESQQLRDRTPFTDASCSHLQYVDNLVVIGADAAQVDTSFKNAVGALRNAGLQVHEVELGNDGAQVLGWDISSDAVLKPTRKRFWKIRMSIRYMLRRGRASAKQVEKLLGHCCFLSLARRESLSIFGQAYNFVRRYSYSTDEFPLWASVRKEFDIWDGILPLIFRNLKAEWSEKVYAVDASEWGLGCTIAHMPLDDVKQFGRVCERWRFKDPVASRARAAAGLEVPIPDDDVAALAVEVSRTNQQRKKHARQVARRQVVRDSPDQTVLQQAAVSRQARQRYAAHWETVRVLLQKPNGQLKPTEQVFYNPSLKSTAMTKLPQCKQSLQGWRKLCPPRSRLPIPWEVVCLLVTKALEEQKRGLALHMLMMFCLYLRPTEALRVRPVDVVEPVKGGGRGYRDYTIVLHPLEVGTSSKTQEFDESLTLDLPYHKGVGHAIRSTCRRFNQELPFLRHSNAELQEFLETSSETLELGSLGPIHPYRFRHGGASHDMLHQHRDLQGVQKRGRWKSLSSVRRYEKGSRLAQLFASLPPQVQEKGMAAARGMARRLCSLR
eukprot:Skav213475  [mRNA]  locus=scaffold565:39265:42440:+ [translate_table: standard]